MTTAFAAPVLVVSLPYLADEINEAHRQVAYHARGMLLEAKRAGDALLAAKATVKHGEFKAWIEANCRCSYRSAAVYMQVAKVGKSAEVCTFEGSLAAFLEAHAKPRVSLPRAASTSTERDAERVLNINACVHGAEGAEEIAASEQMAEVSKPDGTMPEVIVGRCEDDCQDSEQSENQVEAAAAKPELNENENDDTPDHQREVAVFKQREALILQLMDHDENERLEMLADALLRIKELEGRLGGAVNQP